MLRDGSGRCGLVLRDFRKARRQRIAAVFLRISLSEIRISGMLEQELIQETAEQPGPNRMASCQEERDLPHCC